MHTVLEDFLVVSFAGRQDKEMQKFVNPVARVLESNCYDDFADEGTQQGVQSVMESMCHSPAECEKLKTKMHGAFKHEGVKKAIHEKEFKKDHIAKRFDPIDEAVNHSVNSLRQD